MGKTNDILLNLSTTPLGQHVQEYTLDDAFFSSLEQDEILGGQCKASVEMNVREASTTVHINITGTVKVTCDRCLDPMEVQLDPIEDRVLLKLAPEAGEDDNAIYVAESQPVFNLSWFMYELIAVSLPVVHSHPEGQCNPQMEAILNELKV